MSQFPKKQRLYSEKSIEKLFCYGASILEDPFRAVWSLEENNDDIFVKVLIIVSKKRLKLAVDRNTVKRRIKESYRLNKNKLECCLDKGSQQLHLAIIYQKEEILDYLLLDKKINLLLDRLMKDL